MTINSSSSSATSELEGEDETKQSFFPIQLSQAFTLSSCILAEDQKVEGAAAHNNVLLS